MAIYSFFFCLFIFYHCFYYRDLKPENLLLKSKDNDTDVRLADFGISRFFDEGFMKTTCGTPAYTAPGLFSPFLFPLSFPPFFPPLLFPFLFFSFVTFLLTLSFSSLFIAEVLESSNYTMAVDLWSIGIITYLLLSGKTPFQANSMPRYLLFCFGFGGAKGRA